VGTEKHISRITGYINLSGYNPQSKSKSTYTGTHFYADASNENTRFGTPFNVSSGMQFSYLSLKKFDEHFGFFAGPSISVVYQFATSKSHQISRQDSVTIETTNSGKQVDIRPGIGAVIGFSYRVTPSFIIYAEVNPTIYIGYSHARYVQDGKRGGTLPESYSSKGETTNTSNNYGLYGGTSAAMVTFVYRITK
jgi:hypothetical protein